MSLQLCIIPNIIRIIVTAQHLGYTYFAATKIDDYVYTAAIAESNKCTLEIFNQTSVKWAGSIASAQATNNSSDMFLLKKVRILTRFLDSSGERKLSRSCSMTIFIAIEACWFGSLWPFTVLTAALICSRRSFAWMEMFSGCKSALY